MVISEIQQEIAMDWLSQNWIWIVVAIGFLLLMRRGGMGCGMGHTGHGDEQANRTSAPQKPADPASGKPQERKPAHRHGC